MRRSIVGRRRAHPPRAGCRCAHLRRRRSRPIVNEIVHLKRSLSCLALTAAILASAASQAAAEPAVGLIKGTGNLVILDTASPGSLVSEKPVTGLGAGERLVDIDYRLHPIGEPPPPSQLFGLSVFDGSTQDTIRLYTIDIATGVATPVAAGAPAPVGGVDYGIDFNPTVDRIRVVSDGDQNLRLNPNTGGLVTYDNVLNPAGEKVTGIAYDRVEAPPVPGNMTTLFGISVTSSSLVTIGSVNGTPVSANTGTLQNAKPLGVALAPNSVPGFDISPSGVAFAALENAAGGPPGIYTIDLNTGAATPAGALHQPLGSLAIVPQSALPPVVAAKDITVPTIAIAGVKRKMSFAAFLKGVAAKVTPSEPASLTGQLLGVATKKKPASFSRVLATKSLPLGSGQRTLKLKPKRKRVGRPSKAFKVRLRVTATDAAGNTGTATRTIKVKPPRAAASPGRR
jgi:hypothetical protein